MKNKQSLKPYITLLEKGYVFDFTCKQLLLLNHPEKIVNIWEIKMLSSSLDVFCVSKKWRQMKKQTKYCNPSFVFHIIKTNRQLSKNNNFKSFRQQATQVEVWRISFKNVFPYSSSALMLL